MKHKIIAALAILIALFTIGITPAAATDGHGSCSIGGYNFTGDITVNGTNRLFAYWRVGYLSPNPNGLEYRVRGYSANSVLQYDTGYVLNAGINSAAATPNVYLGTYNHILINAGRSNDGYPTCSIEWYNF